MQQVNLYRVLRYSHAESRWITSYHTTVGEARRCIAILGDERQPLDIIPEKPTQVTIPLTRAGLAGWLNEIEEER